MTWPDPPLQWPLAPTQVHVWAARFNLADSRVRELEKLLAPSEKKRAARFHFARDRQAYIVSHGVLRELLQSYLNQPAAQFTFAEDTHGKPRLAARGCDLKFNLAHTHGLALIAFCREHEVGVDVEWQGRSGKLTEIAARYFTAKEQVDLAAWPAQKQSVGFFRIWTRKEAILKACGRGLSIAPDKIEVSRRRGENPIVSVCPKEITPKGGWSLWDLEPAPEYIGALALPKAPWKVLTWKYHETPPPRG